MNDYLDQLNEAQRSAVENTEGPSLVIAGAGSGKTRVLTFRIAYLLQKGERASNILALTFTNKAAKEMKERISSIVSDKVSRYLWMGTFHSVFSRILRTEHEAIGFPSTFTIYDASDSKNLIKSIIKEFKLDDKIYKTGVVLNRISGAKNSLISPAVYLRTSEIADYDRSIRMPLIGDIYKEYSRQCRVSGAMDFDDLLMKTEQLFSSHPDILAKYQDIFKYILVDEYQDTNHAQYRIIKQLAQKYQNVCVVGDDAQSIYSFRGARIENILNFQKDYPDYKIFKLEQNYRSTQNIVDAANSIIQKNKKQIPKVVFSENDKGDRIKVLSALTDNEEGFLVANEIGDLSMREHYNASDFAILYRTNMQSRIFEEALRKKNVPYKIYGGLSFYQRKEVKDLISYFRMVINPLDNEAFKRIINYPARGIGNTTLSKLEQQAMASETSLWEALNSLKNGDHSAFNAGTLGKLSGFADLLQELIDKREELEAFDMASAIATNSGLLKDLYLDRSPEGLSRYENIQELLNGIQEFTTNAREEGRPNNLHDYLSDVALLTDQDNERPEDRNKVTLMTVHSAKGLEFKIVFIVGVEDQLFPASYGGQAVTQQQLEEERRLFYVALTRAEQKVYLSFAKQRYQWGKLEFCRPSRFITDIDPCFLEAEDRNAMSSFARPEVTAATSGSFHPKSTSPSVPMSMLKRLSGLKETGGGAASFQGDDPSLFQSGMTVEHQRFGQGKILQLEGEAPNLKATVFFQSAGQKQLLLKFAKLKIVK